MFRFQEFKVYKDSLALTKEIRKLTKSFPKEELFGLTSQIVRAVDSVVLNIAEGSDRYSDKDFSRFLNQAIASVAEVVACLDIAKENQFIESKEYDIFIAKVESIYKQLNAFCAKVRKDSKI